MVLEKGQPHGNYGPLQIKLTCRELRGALKASLHQSGQWHYAYSQKTFEEQVKDVILSKEDRFIKKWVRPEIIALGITLAFRIVTPHSAVTSFITEKESDINWIPNCSTPLATEIDIIITSPSTPVGWPGKNKMGTKLVGYYKLANYVTVWVVYWVVNMPHLPSVSKGTANFYKGRSYNDLKSDYLRALVFGKEPDGSRVLYDCAVVGKD